MLFVSIACPCFYLTQWSVDMRGHSPGYVFPLRRPPLLHTLGQGTKACDTCYIVNLGESFGKEAQRWAGGSLDGEFWANQNMSTRETLDSWLIHGHCTLGEKYRKEGPTLVFQKSGPSIKAHLPGIRAVLMRSETTGKQQVPWDSVFICKRGAIPQYLVN